MCIGGRRSLSTDTHAVTCCAAAHTTRTGSSVDRARLICTLKSQLSADMLAAACQPCRSCASLWLAEQGDRSCSNASFPLHCSLSSAFLSILQPSLHKSVTHRRSNRTAARLTMMVFQKPRSPFFADKHVSPFLSSCTHAAVNLAEGLERRVEVVLGVPLEDHECRKDARRAGEEHAQAAHLGHPGHTCKHRCLLGLHTHTHTHTRTPTHTHTHTCSLLLLSLSLKGDLD